MLLDFHRFLSYLYLKNMALENCLYQIIGLNSKYFLHRHEHPEHFQYHVLHLLYKNSFDLMKLHYLHLN